MKKVEKMITKVCETTDGKCADMYAYVTDETCGEITLGCEIGGNDEIFTLCYAWISPEDPEDVPSTTFDSREEALESEYSEVYKEMIAAAEKELAK